MLTNGSPDFEDLFRYTVLVCSFYVRKQLFYRKLYPRVFPLNVMFPIYLLFLTMIGREKKVPSPVFTCGQLSRALRLAQQSVDNTEVVDLDNEFS